MIHEVPDLDLVFTVLCELRPVVGDIGIKIQLTAIGQYQGTKEGHGLRAAVNVHNGVRLPRLGLLFIDMAAPNVYDHLTVNGHCERSPQVLAFVNAPSQLVANRRKFVVTKSVNVSHLLSLKALAASAQRKSPLIKRLFKQVPRLGTRRPRVVPTYPHVVTINTDV